MTWAATAVGVGGSLVGGLFGSRGAKRAAREQARAAQAAIDEQRRQFDLTRQDLAPYREVGVGALNQLAALSGVGGQAPDFSNFFASPDYQFRKEQGMQGIERSYAARGLGQSGNALTALADYNSNLASAEFGNYANRLAGLAGVGQTAVGQSAAAGANAANNISGTLVAGGNARASGVQGQYDAWGNALADIGYTIGRALADGRIGG